MTLKPEQKTWQLLYFVSEHDKSFNFKAQRYIAELFGFRYENPVGNSSFIIGAEIHTCARG